MSAPYRNGYCGRKRLLPQEPQDGTVAQGDWGDDGPREDDSRDGDDKEEDRKGVATTAVVLERVL